MTEKAKQIAYWITTVLVASFIGSGGISQIVQFHSSPHSVVPVLGYPMYFFAILGFWKALGAIAILWPGLPRPKEWAYAGIVFDLTGAAASCVAVGVTERTASCPRPSHHYSSGDGIMGPSAAKPHPWSPCSNQNHAVQGTQ